MIAEVFTREVISLAHMRSDLAITLLETLVPQFLDGSIFVFDLLCKR